MSITREMLVFLTGAQAFHTLSHLWLGFAVALPMQLKRRRMSVTPALNTFAVVVNALIAAALLWWAAKV